MSKIFYLDKKNPIIKLKRNEKEFKNLLNYTSFKYIKNNKFPDKYRIYIHKFEYKDDLNDNVDKIIEGYIIDYKYLTFNCGNYNRETLTFLFLDLNKNFYILNFRDYFSKTIIVDKFLKKYYYDDENKNFNFDIIHLKNLNVYFDSFLYIRNIGTNFTEKLLSNIGNFTENKLSDIKMNLYNLISKN
jgi:hypothetical protein